MTSAAAALVTTGRSRAAGREAGPAGPRRLRELASPRSGPRTPRRPRRDLGEQPGRRLPAGGAAGACATEHSAPDRPGQLDEPDAVEVEDGGGVGAVPGGRVIAGHAVHAGRPGVRARGDLALERDPVPVTAVDARPPGDPRVGEQPHPVGRRELHPRAGVVAGQDRVGEPGELGRARPDPVGGQRRGDQVGDHDRTRRRRGQEARRPRAGAAAVTGTCRAAAPPGAGIRVSWYGQSWSGTSR